jgi:hypothetical protein
MEHPDGQSTSPQASSPQLSEQAQEALQDTPPRQAPSAQLIVQAVALHVTCESQASAAQVTWHGPVPQDTPPWHAEGRHCTSQAPVPQSTRAAQELVAHSIWHVVALPHETVPLQEAVPWHTSRQGTSAGQTQLSAQLIVHVWLAQLVHCGGQGSSGGPPWSRVAPSAPSPSRCGASGALMSNEGYSESLVGGAMQRPPEQTRPGVHKTPAHGSVLV